jgi:hypothetical protein
MAMYTESAQLLPDLATAYIRLLDLLLLLDAQGPASPAGAPGAACLIPTFWLGHALAGQATYGCRQAQTWRLLEAGPVTFCYCVRGDVDHFVLMHVDEMA